MIKSCLSSKLLLVEREKRMKESKEDLRKASIESLKDFPIVSQQVFLTVIHCQYNSSKQINEKKVQLLINLKMRRFHSTRKSRNNERDDVFMNVFYNAVKAYEKFNNQRVEQIIASTQNSRRTSSRSSSRYGITKTLPRRGAIFKKSMKFLEKNNATEEQSLEYINKHLQSINVRIEFLLGNLFRNVEIHSTKKN